MDPTERRDDRTKGTRASRINAGRGRVCARFRVLALALACAGGHVARPSDNTFLGGFSVSAADRSCGSTSTPEPKK